MDNKKVENKKQMSNKKKFWIGMSSLAAIGIITATIAYFQASHNFENNFVASSYNVTIKQILDQNAASKVSPGQEIEATVSVKNEGTGPILARIKYVPGTMKDGTIDWKTDEKSGNEIGLDLSELKKEGWKADFDENNFEKGTDGYYYYKGSIANGTTVTHLNSITLLEGENDYKKSEQYLEKKGSENWVNKPENEEMPYGSSYGEKATITSSEKTPIYMKAVVETIQATKKDGTELIMGDTPSATNIQGAWTTLTTPSTP